MKITFDLTGNRPFTFCVVYWVINASFRSDEIRVESSRRNLRMESSD
jgi:hypothetical protein